MKLKKLWIQNYMNFYDTTIVFNNEYNVEFQKNIFKRMNVILFSGQNGSGKTSIVSFIAKIFRYLQRYRERLTSDYLITYEIMVNGKIQEITIMKKREDIFLKVNNEQLYLKKYNLTKKAYEENLNIKKYRQVDYTEIKTFLPSIIAVYGFDTSYADLGYAPKYKGDRIVKYTSLDEYYDTSAIGKFISKGIVLFYYRYYNNKRLRSILKEIGIELIDYVDIYENIDQYNGKYEENETEFLKSGISCYLIKKTKDCNNKLNIKEYIKKKSNYEKIKKLVDLKIIYINDFYIKKNGNAIPISKMSTGEKIFLFGLFSLLTNIKENGIYIWEEPETHLNVNWARNLIPILVELLNRHNILLLLTSHNTYMIKCLFNNQIFIVKKNEIKQVNFNTFLANDSEINNRLFDSNNSDLFENDLIQYMKKCDIYEKKELMNVLGESYLKFMLFKMME
ncbi:AAA family ATPase [Faecalibacillus faecis]|uniref:AAA family ATPase n=1 Tax=Faecalibacillus faecis TaxID=1982628 RepID=UPI003AB7DB9C|nr:AAA family ATPase [Coprobacillus sp.]